MSIYDTYLNAKKSLNKEVGNNDGFKRIFSNSTIKDGKSYCSEIRTESYTKKPFKGNSYSKEKPRWFKEEDESTKKEEVDNSENKEPENTSSDSNTQKEQAAIADENNNQENTNNDSKETEDKALNVVLEDINQLIDEASSKLDGPFTYGSMADYLSEVITKSLLLLAIDENSNQNSDGTHTQTQQNNNESNEKEIDISDNNEAQSQSKEENKES